MASAYGREQCRRQVTTRRLKCARAHTWAPATWRPSHRTPTSFIPRLFVPFFRLSPLTAAGFPFIFYSSHQTNAVRFLDLSPPPPPPGPYNNITIDTYRTHNIIPICVRRSYIYIYISPFIIYVICTHIHCIHTSGYI